MWPKQLPTNRTEEGSTLDNCGRARDSYNNGVSYTQCSTQEELPESLYDDDQVFEDSSNCDALKNELKNTCSCEKENSNKCKNGHCDNASQCLEKSDRTLKQSRDIVPKERHVTFRILKPKDKKRSKTKMKEWSQTWSFLLKDFTQNTTLHGIRFITLDTRFVLRRVLWALLLIITIGIFLFYVYDRVNEFRQFKRNISVEENYVPSMTFPSITFCNQNRVRLTAAAKRGWYDTVSNLFKQTTDKEMRDCRAHEFLCAASRLCIPHERRCDAYPDCQDGSDERNCAQCARLQVSAEGRFTYTLLLQQSASFAPLPDPVYAAILSYGATAASSCMVFLFYNETQSVWVLSNSVFVGNVIDNFPGSQGTVPTGTQISADSSIYQIACAPLQMSDIKDPQRSNRSENNELAQAVSMERLYTEGSHEKEVFIDSCSWKGRPCALKHFKEKITDLGVCYTFQHPEMNVEASGPGNGLTLYLNIEQYEYTRDAGKGVGIKVLIHEEGHVTMMEEAGISISPGLYSLLAMEKTEITNLKYPWGNCSEFELRYFARYSMSACKLDHDNTVARAECGCRGAEMPSVGRDDAPVCTIKEYTSCLLPKLASARSSNSYGRCKIPCQEHMFVPSLSFASISIDADTIKSRRQEAKMAKLESKLTEAREITYRLADDKYRETLRVMSILDFRVQNLIVFLNATELRLYKEAPLVIQDFDYINKDCKYLLDTSRRLQTLVQSSLNPTLQKFQTLLQILEFQLGDFAYVESIGDTVSEVNENRFLQDIATLEQTIYIKPLTVNFTYTNEFENETMNGTVTIKLPDFDVDSSVSNYKFDVYAYYIMLRSRLYTVTNSVDMAKEYLLTELNITFDNFPTEVTVDLGGVKTSVSFHETKSQLLHYVNTVSSQLDLIHSEATVQFSQRINSLLGSTPPDPTGLERKLENVMQLTNRTIHETVAEAVAEYRDLANILSPKCEYESNNLKAGFLEAQDQVISRMGDLREGVSHFTQNTSAYMRAYIRANVSLHDVAQALNLEDDRNSINAYALSIENLIGQKVVTVRRLMGHGQSLKELSQRFIPSGGSNETTGGFGLDTLKLAKDTVDQLRLHVRAIQEALLTQQMYLTEYAEGNILNEEFFKKNYLQLDVFYKTLTDKRVTQQKAYEYPALLSEVGGLMGLLLGASLITIFELLDVLLYNALVKCCERRSKKHASYSPSKDLQSAMKWPTESQPSGNHTQAALGDEHAHRRKRLVPLASMDPMDGLDLTYNTVRT